MTTDTVRVVLVMNDGTRYTLDKTREQADELINMVTAAWNSPDAAQGVLLAGAMSDGHDHMINARQVAHMGFPPGVLA